MEWMKTLFLSEGIAQSIIILASVITIGFLLAKVKIAKISFGATWILFAGIAFSHFGISINSHILHFVKEFGLILFVYSVGLQVGPGFFASLKKGGLKLNLLASAIVLLGVLTTLVIYLITGLPISTMVGILSGAITNTPGLGAAQQTYLDINGVNDPSIALGYALAYPLGVVGIITSMILVKSIFRINLEKENQRIKELEKDNPNETIRLSVLITNFSLFGKTIMGLKQMIDKNFVISRVCDDKGIVLIANADIALQPGYKILIIAQKRDIESLLSFFGTEIEMNEEEWGIKDSNFVPRRVLVTQNNVNGRSLSDLKLGKAFGITVTRINRAGVDLLATPNLQLQIGDRLTIVGTQTGIDAAANLLGNSMKRLREPNLIAIFLGIALGIFLGSIPIFFPGIPQPVKLGLAGGPLIVAILISRFGPKYKLVTYTTMSANLMLREIGISLFLACVGLDSGSRFVDTIVNGGGAIWILYGAVITVLPLMIVATAGRVWFKLNYYTLTGLMAGSTTDPPALAYSNATAGNDLPAVSYATVYPLTMFLRVLMAQLMILFF
ncbi:MAG: transporter [Bacteroidetes bacterium GWF2_40_14]|nr:MAG: transporter [Bacteroidetes bacterium GWF2_40_14]